MRSEIEATSRCSLRRLQKRADGGHDEGGGDDGGHLVVQELGDRPWIEDEGAEVAQAEDSVGAELVPDRVLHEGVGRDDEVAREPAADEERDRGEEVAARTEPSLAPDQQGEEARLEEEGEDPLHRQRLPDDVAGAAREGRPVGAELELHRDAGDHAHREVQAEDADPEARGVVVAALAGRSATALSTTISSASPIVSCGKR